MQWTELKRPIYDKWRSYWFATHPKEIAEYSWDYLFTGGKEIRAQLFCELWSYLSPDLEVDPEFAFMIECIHVASLILDDMPMMDNAITRRGKLALHRYYSDKKALLICYDVMKIVQTIWISKCPPFISQKEWNLLLKGKLQKLITGQWFDLCKKGTLYELASFKTGVLFEFVSELVAVLTQLDSTFWREWGNRLGILFQWMDDWKDQEEDQIQGSRNAFNESYDTTLYAYSVLWKQIETGMGISWFSTPFGRYLKEYFTHEIPLLSIDLSLTTLYDRIHQFTIPLFSTLSVQPVDGITITMKLLPQKKEQFPLSSVEYDKIKEIGFELLDELDQIRDSSCRSISSFLEINSSITDWEMYLPELKEWTDREMKTEEDLRRIIQILLYIVEQMDSIPPPPIDLWSLPEEEWLNRTEWKEYAHGLIQKHTG